MLTTPRYCKSFADAASKTVMVLFGDSRQRHWWLAVFTKGACNAASVEIYLPLLKRGFSECVTWRNRALARIHQLHPAVIVTSSDADGGNALGQKGSQASIWVKAWTTTTRRLVQAGTRVVYLNDTPWPKQNVPDCVAQHPRQVESCAQTTNSRRLRAGVRPWPRPPGRPKRRWSIRCRGSAR